MSKKAIDIYSGTIFSECVFMHEGLLKNTVNWLKEERRKNDEKALRDRKDLLDKARRAEKEKEYNKIPKEERDKIDKVLLDIFNKMETYLKSKCSGKYYFWKNNYDNKDNSFMRYMLVIDSTCDDKYNGDIDEYINNGDDEKFSKFMYKLAEGFCKSNNFDITDSSNGSDRGYYYIFAKGKNDYENIEFCMRWQEDSAMEYGFELQYKR